MSIEVTPRDMSRDESLQRVIEGLKLSASCAAELQVLYPKDGWGKVKEALYHLIASSRKLATVRGISRQDLLRRTDRIQKTQNMRVQQV